MSEEPIPLDDLDVLPDPQPIPVPVPVPVPPPGAGDGVTPVPVPVSPPEKVEDDKIALVDWDEDSPSGETPRKMIGPKLTSSNHNEECNRPLKMTGKVATRCRLFRAKIADAALLHMENAINEWLDEGEVEIKFATQCIGTLEGKRPEPNLLVLVWY